MSDTPELSRMLSECIKEISFLGGNLEAFKERIYTDIQLRPGKSIGPCIPAHRVILASRSKILKQMLSEATSDDNTMTFPELNGEELECLLEFLYGGRLDRDKMEKHVGSLFHAAHVYDIPYLQECCERYILDYFLNVSNVLDALEMSQVFSNRTIREAAMNFIVENMDDVTSSLKYRVFAEQNSHLSVQITRAFVNHVKNNNNVKKEDNRLENESERVRKKFRE